MQVDIFQGHNVRTEVVNDRLTFCVKDTCEILGDANPSNVVKRIRERDLHKVEVTDSLGRPQATWFTTERGLIRILQTSRSPLAEPFQDWADERVEQLMQGKTVNAAGPVGEDALIAQAMNILDMRVKRLELENQQMKPLADAYQDFLGATGLISMKRASDLLTEAGVPIGRNSLFKELERLGWIYRESGAWVPMESKKRQGLITAKAQTRPDYASIIPGVRKLADPKIHLTPKGLHRLRELLLPPMQIEQVA